MLLLAAVRGMLSLPVTKHSYRECRFPGKLGQIGTRIGSGLFIIELFAETGLAELAPGVIETRSGGVDNDVTVGRTALKLPDSALGSHNVLSHWRV